MFVVAASASSSFHYAFVYIDSLLLPPLHGGSRYLKLRTELCVIDITLFRHYDNSTCSLPIHRRIQARVNKMDEIRFRWLNSLKAAMSMFVQTSEIDGLGDSPSLLASSLWIELRNVQPMELIRHIFCLPLPSLSSPMKLSYLTRLDRIISTKFAQYTISCRRWSSPLILIILDSHLHSTDLPAANNENRLLHPYDYHFAFSASLMAARVRWNVDSRENRQES